MGATLFLMGEEGPPLWVFVETAAVKPLHYCRGSVEEWVEGAGFFLVFNVLLLAQFNLGVRGWDEREGLTLSSDKMGIQGS